MAHRLAVDGHAERLVVLDGVPILEHFERCDDRFASAWWHWFFFAQTEKPGARRSSTATPTPGTAPTRRQLGRGEPRGLAGAPSTTRRSVRAMVGDYRAGLRASTAHDEAADRAAGRLVDCPTLVVWSLQDDLEELHGDPVAIWRSWVTGPLERRAIDSGHHMAEEAPEEVAAALAAFLR